MTNNNVTELVFIMDRSGSMSGKEKDTIGGFNSMIESQKKAEGKAFVTTVLFSHSEKTVHDRLPLEDISPMTEKDYSVGGNTALFDAVAHAIIHISDIHKYARKEDVPSKTIFVIITDGMENASREFNGERVKNMLKEKEARGWQFVFLAENLDAATSARTMGISEESLINYDESRVSYFMADLGSEIRCCRETGDFSEGYAKRVERRARERISKDGKGDEK